MCSAHNLTFVSTSRAMIMSPTSTLHLHTKETSKFAIYFHSIWDILHDNYCKLLFNLRMTAYYVKQWKYLHYRYYIFPVTQIRCLHFRSPVQSIPTLNLCKETASNVKITLNTPILIPCSPKKESYIYSAFSPSCSNENLQVNLPLFILTGARTLAALDHLLNWAFSKNTFQLLSTYSQWGKRRKYSHTN